MIKPHNDNSFQALWSRSINHHQPYRWILISDQTKHKNLITYIYDLTLHNIFNPWTHGLMIFPSLYSFSSFSIPWTKTTCDQYLGPNTLDQYLRPNTLDQNTLDQNFGFSTCAHLSSCESACTHIHSICAVNPCIYVIFLQWTHVYNLTYLKISFLFNFLILICSPLFLHPILLYHYFVPSK